MVIALIGESCTGKSSVSKELQNKLNAKIYSGKDYLRLSKSEEESKLQFKKLLKDNEESPQNIIYIISEAEQTSFLPEKTIRILFTAPLETIKERFSKRMNGHLPEPVAKSLEKKHGMFDNIAYDLNVNGEMPLQAVCDKILGFLNYPL